RAVDRLQDVLTGQATIVAARAGRPEHLGEDLQAFSPLSTQSTAEHLLGAGAGVGVGSVEGSDPQLQRLPYAGGGDLLLHLGAVRQPVAVGDLADDQAGPAKVSKFHVP